MEECLAGATREAARALGLLDRVGTLEVGKSADLALWNIERPAELVYRIGFNPSIPASSGVRRYRHDNGSHPGRVRLHDLADIYWNDGSARLDPSFDDAILQAAARIAEIRRRQCAGLRHQPGFGKLASIRIASADLATLQRNLILSHCCGFGVPLPETSCA